MSSFIYNRGKTILAKDLDWSAGGVLRALLERSTSTYVPSKDHDFLDDFTTGGGVEISVAAYSRKTLAGRAVNEDLVNDRAELDCSDIAWGLLEVGQTVKAVIYYRQVGIDDTTPADDELIAYYDGKIDVTLAAPAALNATTLYVKELPAALANGTALNFGGGATCTLSAASAVGAQQLAVTALAAAAALNAVSTDVPVSGNILPFVLGGGAFDQVINVEGLLQIR